MSNPESLWCVCWGSSYPEVLGQSEPMPKREAFRLAAMMRQDEDDGGMVYWIATLDTEEDTNVVS